MSKACLAKWLWRYREEREALWHAVISTTNMEASITIGKASEGALWDEDVEKNLKALLMVPSGDLL